MAAIAFSSRLRSGFKAAMLHFILSLVVAGMAAALVFGLWFPGAFRDMAGGTELFWLIVSVDVVCGPLLTWVLFNPAKPRAELWRDLSLVALIQLAALVYGLWTLWDVRPLYFPLERDRFKVVSRNDLRGASTDEINAELQPGFFKGPITLGLRAPKDEEERQKVLFAALSGGADYGERPDFYLPYNQAVAAQALAAAKPLKDFLLRYPQQTEAAQKILKVSQQSLESAKYLPIRARKDWIAVMDARGQIAGYLAGDGF